jgi:competence protein ComGC
MPKMSKKLQFIAWAAIAIFLACSIPAALSGQGKGQKGGKRVSQQDLQQVRTRIMGIKDEASLDTALANLVNGGRLTQEQAAKIKAQWQKQQARNQKLPALARLRAIEDEGKLNEALNRLVADGKITQAQAAKIQQQWQKNHGRAGAQPQRKALRGAQLKKAADLAKILKKVKGAKNEAKVDNILNKLVTNGRITQEQAAKVKEQWKKRR